MTVCRFLKRKKAPYVANFLLTVRQSESPSSTDGPSEKPIQELELQDSCAATVRCKALGTHAGCEELAVGNKVVIFFAVGQVGRVPSAGGALWIFDDAFVLPSGKESARPVRESISIS